MIEEIIWLWDELSEDASPWLWQPPNTVMQYTAANTINMIRFILPCIKYNLISLYKIFYPLYGLPIWQVNLNMNLLLLYKNKTSKLLHFYY